MSSVSGAAGGIAADGGSPEAQAATQAAEWKSAAGSRTRAAHVRSGRSDMFARSILDYARQHPAEQVKLLQAGCTGPADDLGLDGTGLDGTGLGSTGLGSTGAGRASWLDVSVRGIDQDHPLTRKIARSTASQASSVPLVLGDMRTIPLPPRAFDIVGCVHLLDRIEHAELVLDRLVAALRPGGLLLLRFRDRECAAGLLDRMLPQVARRAVWHWLRPQQAGPFPAVYEPLLSADGMHAYTLARGLVIAERQTLRDRPRRPGRLAWGAPLACRLIAALSRGRLPDDHDDLLYVIRKPENRFARVL
jgi:SAM-dependent methyltransferase